MARVLITGADGFVGAHLADHLIRRGDEIFGTIFLADGARAASGSEPGGPTPVRLLPCDVRDEAEVAALFERVRPEQVYHLAAVTYVPAAEANPRQLFATNVTGTLNVLEAARRLGEGACRVLAVGSGEVYGTIGEEDGAADEDTPLAPGNLYAASKAAADLMADRYARHRGVWTVRARPFNHTGPGQAPTFVCSDFARQVARIDAGLHPPRVQVGNLEAVRDFCDVRDVAAAYAMMMEKGESGSVYNVCSGKGRRIADVVETLLSMSRVKIELVQDSERLRPSEVSRMVGSNARIRNEIGWRPTIDFTRTLSDLLAWWRDKTRESR